MSVINNYSHLVVSCVFESLPVVQAMVDRILGDEFSTHSGELALDRIYTDYPPEGGAHQMKLVFFSPKASPDLTIFFCNLSDGWNSIVYRFSDELSTTCIQIQMSDARDPWPACSFEILNGWDSVRYVRAMKEDRGWEFYEHGTPLEIENTELYKKRRIRDRLPPSEICRLMKALGWAVEDDAFWTSTQDAVYYSEKPRS